MTKISKKFIETLKMLGYSVSEETNCYFILNITEHVQYMFTRHSNSNLYIGIPLTPTVSSLIDSRNISSILDEFIHKLKHFFKTAHYKGNTVYINAEDILWN